MFRYKKLAVLWLMVVSLTGCEYVDDMPVLGRYMAKNVCSGLFVEGYTEKELVDELVTPLVPFIKHTWLVDVDTDLERVSVTNSIFSKVDSVAIHRPPAGCVNLVDYDEALLKSQAPIPYEPAALNPDIDWPYGAGGAPDISVEGVDYAGLERALDKEFDEKNGKNTTAMLVIYKDKIVAERYHPSIDSNSPLKGFSMSKPLVNILTGMLEQDGLVSLGDNVGIAEWQGDQRQTMTINDLLLMESGLDYLEQAVGAKNDQGNMLYGIIPAVHYAIERSLAASPGTVFNYSSGDNLILGSILQQRLGGASQAIYDYLQARVFEPIGVTSAVVEFDASGSVLSSESLFLSARDWARFIRLYVKNGEWDGQQLLPRDWVEFSLQPTDLSDQFGASIWVNKNHSNFHSLPEDAIAFYGALERFIIAVPSMDVIVFRTGFTHNRPLMDMDEVMQSILEHLPVSTQD